MMNESDLTLQHKETHLKSDVDSSVRAQHHTIGRGPLQASPGDHTHDGITSPAIIPSLTIWPTLLVEAPEGWALLNGDILPISDWPNLFAVFGTNFGGDGIIDFGVPNMVGKVLRGHVLPAATGGIDNVTLLEANLPPHTHSDGTLTVASSGGHRHTVNWSGADGASAAYYRRGDPAGTTGNNDNIFDDADGLHTHDVSGATGSGAGTSTPFSVVPTFLGTNFMIKE